MRKLGWRPDKVDARDVILSKSISFEKIDLPYKLTLRHLLPPVFNQNDTNTCTAQVIVAALYIAHIDAEAVASRLYLYYYTRFVEYGHAMDDCGASLRSTLKALSMYGHCDEEAWSFDTEKVNSRPCRASHKAARDSGDIEYTKVSNPSENDIKYCLYKGWCVAFGTKLYETHENLDECDVMPIPNCKKERCIGGHALLIVGYDDDTQLFEIRNSWGKDWGDEGYHYMKYEHVLDSNLCIDFWVITSLSMHLHTISSRENSIIYNQFTLGKDLFNASMSRKCSKETTSPIKKRISRRKST
jgi:hypothetical protein